MKLQHVVSPVMSCSHATYHRRWTINSYHRPVPVDHLYIIYMLCSVVFEHRQHPNIPGIYVCIYIIYMRSVAFEHRQHPRAEQKPHSALDPGAVGMRTRAIESAADALAEAAKWKPSATQHQPVINPQREYYYNKQWRFAEGKGWGRGPIPSMLASVIWPLTMHPFRDRGIGRGGRGESTGARAKREAVITMRSFGSGTMSNFTSFGGNVAFFYPRRAIPPSLIRNKHKRPQGRERIALSMVGPVKTSPTPDQGCCSILHSHVDLLQALLSSFQQRPRCCR